MKFLYTSSSHYIQIFLLINKTINNKKKKARTTNEMSITKNIKKINLKKCLNAHKHNLVEIK